MGLVSSVGARSVGRQGNAVVDTSVTPPPGVEVFEPPDILYWARGNDNSTVYDKLGLPWYCYTLQQTHCVPLFKTPANYRTTRRPAQKTRFSPPERKTTTPPASSRRPVTSPPTDVGARNPKDLDGGVGNEVHTEVTDAPTFTTPFETPPIFTTPSPTIPIPVTSDPTREDATLGGSNYILTLVDGFLVPKENNKASEDESRVEISGRETFPATPVTASAATVAAERRGSTGNSPENVRKTALTSSVHGGSGSGHPDSNVVETESEFPKMTERRTSAAVTPASAPLIITRHPATASYPTSGSSSWPSEGSPNATFTNTAETPSTPTPTHLPSSSVTFSSHLPRVRQSEDIATGPSTNVSTSRPSTRRYSPRLPTTTEPTAAAQFNANSASASPLVSADPTPTAQSDTAAQKEAVLGGRSPTATGFLRRTPKEETICLSCEVAEWWEEENFGKSNDSQEAGSAVTVAGDSGYRWDTDRDTEMQFWSHTANNNNTETPATATAITITGTPPTAITSTQTLPTATAATNINTEITTVSLTSSKTPTTAKTDIETASNVTNTETPTPLVTHTETIPTSTAATITEMTTITNTNTKTPTTTITNAGEPDIASTNTEAPTTAIINTETSSTPMISEETSTAKTNPDVTAITTNTETPATTLPFAPAYTVFGEPCRDACERRGYSYSWCHKTEPSSVGTWWDSGYCSTLSNRTPHAEVCRDACDNRGYSYFWCHKSPLLWGYCTPQKLLDKAAVWNRYNDSLPEGASGVDVRGRFCRDRCVKLVDSQHAVCKTLGEQEEAATEYCSLNPGYTSDGWKCVGECEWRDDGRFACATTDENGENSFCSPTHLLEKIENL